MKKLINNTWTKWLLIPVLTLFFLSPAAFGQEEVENEQRINKTQRFTDLDTNGDGFINANEYKFRDSGKYDTNLDGKLSRNEYTAMNRELNRNQGSQTMKGKNSGNKQGARNGQGNGQGKGNKAKKGNRQKGSKGMRSNKNCTNKNNRSRSGKGRGL